MYFDSFPGPGAKRWIPPGGSDALAARRQGIVLHRVEGHLMAVPIRADSHDGELNPGNPCGFLPKGGRGGAATGRLQRMVRHLSRGSTLPGEYDHGRNQCPTNHGHSELAAKAMTVGHKLCVVALCIPLAPHASFVSHRFERRSFRRQRPIPVSALRVGTNTLRLKHGDKWFRLWSVTLDGPQLPAITLAPWRTHWPFTSRPSSGSGTSLRAELNASGSPGNQKPLRRDSRVIPSAPSHPPI